MKLANGSITESANKFTFDPKCRNRTGSDVPARSAISRVVDPA
jgi:hypothetical protein